MAEKVAPGAPFTPIADSYVTAGAPITDRLRTALADNLDHDRQVLLDPDVHVAAKAHAHRGDESAHLAAMPSTPNLITEGLIYPMAANPLSGGGTRWVLHGVTIDDEGLRFTGANQWATHALVDSDRPPHSRTIFGAGCDLVASCYLRASAALTAGQMAIGLTDGGKDRDDDAKAFVPGTRVPIPYTVIGTGWVRVWAVIPRVGGRFENAVRAVVQCEQSPAGGSIAVNLIDVRPGRMLDFYTHGYHTDPYLNWTNFGWTQGPPPFDQAKAFDDAIELAPTED